MTEIDLKEMNVPAHLDVEEDIRKKKNGQMTFTVRMNASKIVDYNHTQYVDTKAKYLGNGPYAEFRVNFKRNAEKQPPVSLDNGEGSE